MVREQYAHKQFRDNLLEFRAAKVDPGSAGRGCVADSVTNSAEEKTPARIVWPALGRRRSVMNPHKLLPLIVVILTLKVKIILRKR